MSLVQSELYASILIPFASFDEQKIKELFMQPGEQDLDVTDIPLVSTNQELDDPHNPPEYFSQCIKFQSLNRSPSKWFSQAPYRWQSRVWGHYGTQVKFGDFNVYVRMFCWVYDHLSNDLFDEMFAQAPKYQEIIVSFQVDNEIKFFMQLEYRYQLEIIHRFRAWEAAQPKKK
jgi:hypothetical protein